MDNENLSPESIDHNTLNDTLEDDNTSSQNNRSRSPDMSVAVAAAPQPFLTPTTPQQGPVPGVNKRYRPAPAKTFQCRGYGECRMVFSRSEHLARHIRYAPFYVAPDVRSGAATHA